MEGKNLATTQGIRIVGADEQTTEERELATHVRSKVESIRSQANRIAHEGIWITNTAYCLGYDGIFYNTDTRSFQPLNKGAGGLKRSRLHVNKILPTIQNRLARLCKNPPRYEVRPESNSNDDKEAARLSLQILTSLWHRLGINEKRIPLYMWVQQCGHAYIKIGWDPTEGNPMPDLLTGELAYEGEVKVEVASPFEIFPNPLAKTFDEVRKTWLIQAKVRPLDYFVTNYPEKGHLVKEEDAWLLSALYESRINSMNSKGPSQGGMADQMKNSAIELIKYEARSSKHPNGRRIICANGILLEDAELPCGEIPFAKFDDIQVGGKYYSESVVTHLRPIQDQYNELARRRAAWIKQFVAGKYKAPRGSGIAEESLHNGESEVVFYDPVPNAPEGVQPLAIPTMPNWVFTEEDRYTAMFNDISGISEVSRGTLPSASIPAIGMQLLTEQDDTRIGVMTEQHEHAWARVGMLMLKYVEESYELPRKLKIAGPSLEYTVKEIRGADIRKNTDVFVVRGSTQPGSKTLDNQAILNAYQTGLLGDPSDPKLKEKVLGMIEFGEIGGLWEDFGLDMSQIKRGIDKLEHGEQVLVNEFDNHAMWLVELNRIRKSDKFDAFSPEVQHVFIMQMELRIAAIMKAQGVPLGAAPPVQMPPPLAGPMPPPQGAAPTGGG